jgi:hypothetical protein
MECSFHNGVAFEVGHFVERLLGEGRKLVKKTDEDESERCIQGIDGKVILKRK